MPQRLICEEGEEIEGQVITTKAPSVWIISDRMSQSGGESAEKSMTHSFTFTAV